MRCIAARLLLIFFIYLCLSFGVFGSFSIWLSLSVGLSVVVHPLFFLLCVFAVSCFYLCSIYQSSLHALCVSTIHISLPTRLLWISLSRMNSNERRSYGFAFFFCCIFFFLFCLLYSSSSSSSPSSSFSTVSQHYRWILWPIFLVAWLLYATLRCFINEYVFGWFICVASDG